MILLENVNSNYRLAEDSEDDQEASADEPFEPYYITEEDT